MIDIRWLLPESVIMDIWNSKYDANLFDNMYVLETQVNNNLKTDKVDIYVWDRLIDSVDKDISLKMWDTLHIEYIIDVCE